jgi:hypothetical protein
LQDNVNLASIFMQNPAVVGSRRLSSHSGSPDSRQLDAIDQAPFIVVIDCYFLVSFAVFLYRDTFVV